MKFFARFKGLIVFFLVILLLAGALLVGKNIFLGQVKKKIEAAVTYSDLRASFFPPEIILENVMSLSGSPLFSAEKIVIGMSYVSLFRKDKPLLVFIERPVVRLADSPELKGNKAKAFLPLPVAIEKALIRGGEVDYRRKEGHLQSKNVKALFVQREDQFILKVRAEAVFTPAPEIPPFGGDLEFSVSGKGKDIEIHRAAVEGDDFFLKADGGVHDLLNPRIDVRARFNVDAAVVAAFFGLPFDWRGKIGGEGAVTSHAGSIKFDSRVKSADLVLNEVPMGRMNGRVLYLGPVRGAAAARAANSTGNLSLAGAVVQTPDSGSGQSPQEGVSASLSFQKPGKLPENVVILYQSGKVVGRAEQAYLDFVMNYIDTPWPVKSPVWADFTFENGRLEASAEFRDESTEPEGGRYPVQGRARLVWDETADDLYIASAEVRSSFCRVSAESRSKIGRSVDLKINGTVTDIRQARDFTEAVLEKKFPFPEIRGSGTAEIQVRGDYLYPRFTATFSCSPAGFDLFDAQYVQGTIWVENEDFSGEFQVEDPGMRGDIGLVGSGEDVTTTIRSGEGLVEKVLPALSIDLPFEGWAEGDFVVEQHGLSIRTTGDFASESIKFIGQEAKQVKGRLDWKDGALIFPELEFSLYGGRVQSVVYLAQLSRDFDLDVTAQGIDLSFFNPRLKGTLSLGCKGRGRFGRDAATGLFEIKPLEFPPFQKTEARGSLSVKFTETDLDLKIDGSFLPGENGFDLSFHIPFEENSLTGDVKGSFSNLDLLLPWKGAKGRLNYLGELRGLKDSPDIKGFVDFQGPVLPFPQFAHALTDYSGSALIQGGTISVRTFQGKMGGGDILASGTVTVGMDGVKSIDLKADGKDMLVSPLERTRALVDGSATLVMDSRRFALDGDFLVKKLTWRRELYEKFAFSSVPYYQLTREKTFFDDMNLNLHIRTTDDAWMENSLGRARGRFDLSVSGNVTAPIMLGVIDVLGGDVYFQDRKFRVLKGQLSFFNPTTVEPYLDFKGETFVKDYRVTIALSGLASNVRPEFSSSPPLPPEDILALLALGESFKRTYSYDMSTRLSTASLLSFQIADEAQKRAEGLFSLARFRIDPFVMGTSAEMTARLTMGRKISRSLSIMYSTNLTTQREEISRVEWELSNDFSLVGIRNEWGRLSFDIKWRKRF